MTQQSGVKGGRMVQQETENIADFVELFGANLT